MFDRYLDNPKGTEDAFLKHPITGEKWLLTGDCALISSAHNGSFKILGRLSMDIIKRGGYLISALEIETALAEHPLVRDCAVVGVHCQKMGEEIVAFVVLQGD
jgi:malonyl-CoA/methylmalonyl-CoA synthetase